MNDIKFEKQVSDLAESIRKACLEAAAEGFKEASMAGICLEGSIDYAIDAIRRVDLKEIVERYKFSTNDETKNHGVSP